MNEFAGCVQDAHAFEWKETTIHQSMELDADQSSNGNETMTKDSLVDDEDNDNEVDVENDHIDDTDEHCS